MFSKGQSLLNILTHYMIEDNNMYHDIYIVILAQRNNNDK